MPTATGTRTSTTCTRGIYSANFGRFFFARPDRRRCPSAPVVESILLCTQQSAGISDPARRRLRAQTDPDVCTPPPPPKTEQAQPKPAVDVFMFASITGKTSQPEVRGAVEGVSIGRLQQSKWRLFSGDRCSRRGSNENYVAGFEGVETTSDSRAPVGIKIRELSLGVEVPFLAGAGGGFGDYTTKAEHGFFVFGSAAAIGQHGAVGVGASTEALWRFFATPPPQLPMCCS
jgi:hypothetical protein